jgi:xylulokinase
MASVLEAELVTVNTSEGGAFGAALLAGVGAGAWPDVQTACASTIKITGSTHPDPIQMAAYRKAYPHYRDLYPALKSEFEKATL